ncbi:unnamed protein product [Microthlaspi erraticum]|uniref:Uncharacterized protein n=1 Tax=Microthlaspi erraticum TaxID=1685480 RepID=A0A6D2JTM3_9BRAS|nr:unnamed protein product [Microthlaspi erraticum]
METMKRKFKEKEMKKVLIFKKPHNKIRYEMCKEICGSSKEEKEEKMKNLAMTTHEGEGWFKKSFFSRYCCELRFRRRAGERRMEFGCSGEEGENSRGVRDRWWLMKAGY